MHLFIESVAKSIPSCFTVIAMLVTSSMLMYRVLTVHGSMDETVPAEDALEFAKFISNHELRIIEGADHEYSSHQDELACLVLEFIKAHHDKHKDISKQTRFGKVDKHIRSRF